METRLSGEGIRLSGWALVLGASSGFGEATSLALARAGLHVFGVHLDRKATLPNVERIVAEIRGLGREARFYNVNAADAEKRAEVAAEMQRILEERGELGRLRGLLHSLAFGAPHRHADPRRRDGDAIQPENPRLRGEQGHAPPAQSQQADEDDGGCGPGHRGPLPPG